MRQSKDLGSFFELRAKNAPIYNSLPGHFYENLNNTFLITEITRFDQGLMK